jgi:hypothetical protein
MASAALRAVDAHAGVMRPEPGCAPGGAPSFLASPRKEGKRRRPHCLRPSAALRAACGARGRGVPRNSLRGEAAPFKQPRRVSLRGRRVLRRACPPRPLRSSAQAEGAKRTPHGSSLRSTRKETDSPGRKASSPSSTNQETPPYPFSPAGRAGSDAHTALKRNTGPSAATARMGSPRPLPVPRSAGRGAGAGTAGCPRIVIRLAAVVRAA